MGGIDKYLPFGASDMSTLVKMQQDIILKTAPQQFAGVGPYPEKAMAYNAPKPQPLTYFEEKLPVFDYAAVWEKIPRVPAYNLWELIGLDYSKEKKVAPVPFTKEELELKVAGAELALARESAGYEACPTKLDSKANPVATCPKCGTPIKQVRYFAKAEPGVDKWGAWQAGRVEHLEWPCRCGFVLKTATKS